MSLAWMVAEVAQPEAGLLGVVLHALLEDADEVRADDLVVVLAHGELEAEEVLDLQVLQRQRDLGRIGRARLGRCRPGGTRRWCGSPRRRSRTGTWPGTPWSQASASALPVSARDVLVERLDRADLAVAARADRRRAAREVGVHRVVAEVDAGIDARLDQQVHVRAPVAGQQGLRARRLDLGDVGREVLDLAERDQLVADHLHVGPELAEEGLDVALHGLAEEIVLVQQVDLGDVLGQRAAPSPRPSPRHWRRSGSARSCTARWSARSRPRRS